jgi:hypothetical protein
MYLPFCLFSIGWSKSLRLRQKQSLKIAGIRSVQSAARLLDRVPPNWITRVEECLGQELFRYTSAVKHPPILLGTSSFTASGWNGSFYPLGMKPSNCSNYSSRSACIGFAVVARSAGIIVATVDDDTSSMETHT